MSKVASKAFVLLSGGLDSTTALYKAIFDYSTDTMEETRRRISINRESAHNDGAPIDPIPWVEAVSIDYGQRHSKEISYAINNCFNLGIKHTTIPIGDILKDPNTMLTEGNVKIPDVSYADLPHGVSPTYVPFRNGLMLSVLAAHAQKWINGENKRASDVWEKSWGTPCPKDLLHEARAGIYFGAHAEDAQNWAYPDCTPEFIGAMANAIHVGSYYQIRLHTPLMTLLKSEIVEMGSKLGVPFESTWSCYKGLEMQCGVCPTCRSRRDAFRLAGVVDPTQYASQV